VTAAENYGVTQTGFTTGTDFTGGYAEQHMTVRFGEFLSTVSSSGNFELSGGVDDPVLTRGISSLQKRPAEVAGDQSK